MSNEFKILDCSGAKLIADAIGFCPSKFCDFTPFVILMWQKMYKTEYILTDEELFLKLTLDGGVHYGVSTRNIKRSAAKLFNVTGKDCLDLSLITEGDLEILKSEFDVSNIYTREEWWDYLYSHEDLSTLSGKRFAGQRNHINKFKATYTDWCYERVNEDNLSEVKAFYNELTKDSDGLSASASFEMHMVKDYLNSGYHCFPTEGGVIKAGGEIVSFAFGEVVDGTLFVHVEKARRDVQGAYQMIVKEFASHTPAEFINREEDMGIEGLKRSKESYHPIEKLKKYSVTIHR
ncbi:MAG: DUF2156 domain-containing protein [Clostridia bacterium]|nr:DUF2156 domain-containing protein [Clostridia bacterium]